MFLRCCPLTGKIHWVAEPAPGKKPLEVELRLYGRLFKSRVRTIG